MHVGEKMKTWNNFWGVIEETLRNEREIGLSFMRIIKNWKNIKIKGSNP
jgi:hypothetical protein